tara:strand:+ start:191 stop:763 length:573 start_codon:yes stop_codon:yes gene_type:complete
MKTKNLERFLNSFGKQVVKKAQANLKSAGKGGALEKSISFFIRNKGGSLTVVFKMDSYGKFVDQGVSGNSKSRTYKDYKGTSRPSPFKYKTKQPPPGILAKWIKKKGIKGRDRGYTKKDGTKVKGTGRFISNMSLAFIMGRKIKRDGIQGISFFQKPFGIAMKDYAKGLSKSLKQDIIDNLAKSKNITTK